MTNVLNHLIIAPILIPLFAGALMLLYEDKQRREKMAISILSVLAMLFVAVKLLNQSKGGPLSDGNDIGFYLLADWAAPFGIVLVIDRLAAMMLVLTGLLALPALIYSAAFWHRQGQHFHSLFQFLLMGINGAFLTGDLFNLFVFFEVMLAASYGLLLHGSGQLRVRAGLHYIAINLAASLLFLIGVSIIYGVAGTLNMAQLANIVPLMPAGDRPLLHTGIAILGLAFLVKAGVWPLSFWLPTAYMAGAAPVAAMFAIMTKVGVYIILRLSTLLVGEGAGPSAGFGGQVLIMGGLATMVFGILGVLGSQGIGRVAAHLVLISSGTLLSVIGFTVTGGGTQMLSGALFYLVSSTLATSALFLLIEPMSREEGGIADLLALTADAYGLDLTEDEREGSDGLSVPATLTILALCFVGCLIALAGLPPLSGFIGKLVMLRGMIGSPLLDAPMGWAFVAIVILAGLATLIGLIRIGIQTFWASDGIAPRVMPLEIAPIIALLGMIVIMTVQAEDVMRFMRNTAEALHRQTVYVDGVLDAPRAVEVMENSQ
ncbi:monovalent cation/H+ antiporter subunit D [Paracoccus sp. (in: a-proteobacteria)]|uniref:monovalent cation/H+ antiporter subunit D n=1 Tax=Paracoccus sp. TaxID=267 RepID=UPI0026DF2C9C|nr:monovalent cation/H+ antiporter subunit D [Paracoccus sp. (in: a-proteobacteria)]MDO5647818.1 monovalent cation/H+ antiporter subunit D [Paracoccus sp. (in: a-proteobacteria)]